MRIQDYHYEQLEFMAETICHKFTEAARTIGIDVIDPDWMLKVMDRPEILIRMTPLTSFEAEILMEKNRRDIAKVKKHLEDRDRGSK